ncbi:MAG TPA: PA14 domain-containing protein [Abditibacteriaceae bacterium]|jgi:lysophospholipase L1-like esterase
MKHRIFGALCAFAIMAPVAHAQNAAPATQPFFFRDGDRAVIMGDSITEQRLYSTLIESYVLSRFPMWNITFRNSGWSGDTMGLRLRGGVDKGFNRDLAPLRPTAVTIDFGMNDARGGDNSYAEFVANSKKLTSLLQGIGARVALVSPSPEEKYEAGAPAGSNYNNMLLKYSDGLKQVAAESTVPFVDQIRPMMADIERGRAAGVLGAEGNPRLIADAVHPGWAGQFVMATHILKGLNAPSLVSRVEIDARNVANPKATAQNATVATVATKTPAAIQFQRTDNALPWPIHTDTALALKIPGFTPLQDLSRYELKVSNLAAPRYDVRIDDVLAGSWSREELEAGINLTNAPGPINDQGQALLRKILEKNNLYFTRWRQVQLFAPPAWLPAADTETARAKELERLDSLLVAAEAEIDALRKPVSRLWTISPAAPAAPTELALGNDLTLHWKDNANDEFGYRIERSSDGKEFRPVAQVAANATTFVDTQGQVLSVRPLYYRISAVGKDAASQAALISTAWTGAGLRAEYFRGIDLKTPILTRMENVDFAGEKNFGPEIGQEGFSVRWSGAVTAKTSGLYTFTTTTDDGARLFLNNKKMFDDWEDQGPTENSATLQMEAGKWYPITFEYYQGGGGATAKLEWSGAGIQREVIPAAMLRARTDLAHTDIMMQIPVASEKTKFYRVSANVGF